MLDKMARLSKSRKTYRWYIRINIKIIFCKTIRKAHTSKKIDFHTFLLTVIHQLTGEHRFRQQEAGRPQATNVAEKRWLVDISHFSVKSTSEKHVCVIFNEKRMDYSKAQGGKVKYRDNQFKNIKLAVNHAMSTSTIHQNLLRIFIQKPRFYS